MSNVILPSIVINYLSSASFLIPTSSDENIGFSVTIFLAQTVNLMSTSQFIPNGGFEVPVWGKYLVVSIVHLTAIILLNIKLASLRNALNCDERPWLEAVNVMNDVFADCLTFLKNQKTVTPLAQETEPKIRHQKEHFEGWTVKLKRIEMLKKVFFIIDFFGLTVMTVTTLVIIQSE